MIYTDQVMREVRLEKSPSRTISLVPSLTELLCDLELDDRLVGITKFCIHPEKVYRSKTRIGGTKKIDHQKIHDLRPDLIVANKEENLKEDIELLSNKFPVWVSDISTLPDALEMIVKLGEITGKITEAKSINKSITDNFAAIDKVIGCRTLYLIWKNPYMSAGSDTFINDMLQHCGMENVVTAMRYPQLTDRQIQELDPDLVMLSSEPFPFSEKHISEIQSLLPSSKIILVNGEYYSWYGSRLVHSPAYFNHVNATLNSIRA